MNRQIGCIVATAVLGLLALVAMAGYGTTKNPRLWLKGAIEGKLPVAWKEYELADGRAPWERRLVVRVAPRAGEGATRDLADRVALATVEALANPEAPRIDFTSLAVELEGTAPLEAGRYELERRLALERAKARPGGGVVIPRRVTSTAR